jgi:hypothetical protein
VTRSARPPPPPGGRDRDTDRSGQTHKFLGMINQIGSAIDAACQREHQQDGALAKAQVNLRLRRPQRSIGMGSALTYALFTPIGIAGEYPWMRQTSLLKSSPESKHRRPLDVLRISEQAPSNGPAASASSRAVKPWQRRRRFAKGHAAARSATPALVAKQTCLLCGSQPGDPHHLRFAQARELGQKISDEFTARSGRSSRMPLGGDDQIISRVPRSTISFHGSLRFPRPHRSRGRFIPVEVCDAQGARQCNAAC